MNYVFYCKNCSRSGLETFQKKKASKLLCRWRGGMTNFNNCLLVDQIVGLRKHLEGLFFATFHVPWDQKLEFSIPKLINEEFMVGEQSYLWELIICSSKILIKNKLAQSRPFA